jgi:acyl-CoA thioesterase I
MKKVLSVAGFVLCLLLFFAAATINDIRASTDTAFMGDSLTAEWSFPVSNLGEPGQSTAQMVERFPRQVFGHGYKTVVILGGVNDILYGISPDVAAGNIATMVDLAKSHGITPVLCTIPPINPRSDPQVRSSALILNRKIIDLAARRKLTLVDYGNNNTLRDGAIVFRCRDGIHWRRAGYAVMEISFLLATRNDHI